MNKVGHRQAWTYLAIIAIPIACFYAILCYQVSSIPFSDDYDTVLLFMTRFSQLDWPHRLQLVLQFQHNDYKLIFENSIFALQYVFIGKPNFVVLCLLGDLLVFALFAAIWFCLVPQQELTRRLRITIPIAFVLFELRYAETLNWSMAALQNVSVLVCALLCIACLTRNRGLLACLFFGLSIACSGNGFFLLPIGIWLLFKQRRWGAFAAWVAVFLAMALLYSIQYVPYAPQGQPPLTAALLLRRLNPIYTLSFLGSLIGAHWIISALVGTALIIVFLFMAKTRYDLANPAAFYFAAFLILTAVAVASLRSGLGLNQSFTGRYRIYSVLLFTCCYLFAMQRSERWYRPALYGSILFCIAGDLYGHMFYQRRAAEIRADAITYSQDLCAGDTVCHERHIILSRARFLYQLPADYRELTNPPR